MISYEIGELPGCRRYQRLQFVIEHYGNGIDLSLAKLAEQRGRLVIFYAGPSGFILVEQHSQRSIQARSNVVLRHLERVLKNVDPNEAGPDTNREVGS